MIRKTVVAALSAACALSAGSVLAAPTEITMWHAMANTLGDWVADVTKQYNESQNECRLVSTYDQTMTSGIAAHRAGRSPNILQVFEVGTATMMFSKGAVVPVGDLMEKAGYEFHPEEYIPAVLGYYSTPDGRMMSYPTRRPRFSISTSRSSRTRVFRPKPTSFRAPGSRLKRPPAP